MTTIPTMVPDFSPPEKKVSEDQTTQQTSTTEVKPGTILQNWQAAVLALLLGTAGTSGVFTAISGPSQAEIRETVRSAVREELSMYAANSDKIDAAYQRQLQRQFDEIERRITQLEQHGQ